MTASPNGTGDAEGRTPPLRPLLEAAHVSLPRGTDLGSKLATRSNLDVLIYLLALGIPFACVEAWLTVNRTWIPGRR